MLSAHRAIEHYAGVIAWVVGLVVGAVLIVQLLGD
jgi:hypothetical protein